jgi:hypothetical protein
MVKKSETISYANEIHALYKNVEINKNNDQSEILSRQVA